MKFPTFVIARLPEELKLLWYRTGGGRIPLAEFCRIEERIRFPVSLFREPEEIAWIDTYDYSVVQVFNPVFVPLFRKLAREYERIYGKKIKVRVETP